MDKVSVPDFALNDRLRKARLEAGISVEGMAAHLGCSRRTITRWESTGVKVPRSAVLAYHVRCGVDLSWLEKGTFVSDEQALIAKALRGFGIALSESDYTPEELPGIEHALDVLDDHIDEISKGRA